MRDAPLDCGAPETLEYRRRLRFPVVLDQVRGCGPCHHGEGECRQAALHEPRWLQSPDRGKKLAFYPCPLPFPTVLPVPGSFLGAERALGAGARWRLGMGKDLRVGFFRSFCSEAVIFPQMQTAKDPLVIISFLPAPLVVLQSHAHPSGPGS